MTFLFYSKKGLEIFELSTIVSLQWSIILIVPNQFHQTRTLLLRNTHTKIVTKVRFFVCFVWSIIKLYHFWTHVSNKFSHSFYIIYNHCVCRIVIIALQLHTSLSLSTVKKAIDSGVCCFSRFSFISYSWNGMKWFSFFCKLFMRLMDSFSGLFFSFIQECLILCDVFFSSLLHRNQLIFVLSLFIGIRF